MRRQMEVAKLRNDVQAVQVLERRLLEAEQTLRLQGPRPDEEVRSEAIARMQERIARLETENAVLRRQVQRVARYFPHLLETSAPAP